MQKQNFFVVQELDTEEEERKVDLTTSVDEVAEVIHEPKKKSSEKKKAGGFKKMMKKEHDAIAALLNGDADDLPLKQKENLTPGASSKPKTKNVKAESVFSDEEEDSNPFSLPKQILPM